MSDLFGGPEGEGPLQPTFRATQEQAAIMLERNSRVCTSLVRRRRALEVI